MKKTKSVNKPVFKIIFNIMVVCRTCKSKKYEHGPSPVCCYHTLLKIETYSEYFSYRLQWSHLIKYYKRLIWPKSTVELSLNTNNKNKLDLTGVHPASLHLNVKIKIKKL